jgi:hypothetical protein
LITVTLADVSGALVALPSVAVTRTADSITVVAHCR